MIGFDAENDVWVLWEDSEVRVCVPTKTSWPAHYGGWVVVFQKQNVVGAPYNDYRLFAKMSVIAAAVQNSLEYVGLAPHANIQSNANWAFRKSDGSLLNSKEGRERRKVHIHIFGRKVEDPAWADPIVLPTFQEYYATKDCWGKIWSEEDMNKLVRFLEYEVPLALNEMLRK